MSKIPDDLLEPMDKLRAAADILESLAEAAADYNLQLFAPVNAASLSLLCEMLMLRIEAMEEAIASYIAASTTEPTKGTKDA